MTLIRMPEKVTEKELRDFNKSLMTMISLLQNENDILKEKVEHLECILLAQDVPIIGGSNE